jgi:trans-aconitate 2-methyltransferase
MPWSPAQYLKFEDERTRPPRDLLARVPLDRVANAVDLGCGPGNSTELLVERFGADVVSGLDNDAQMLAAAQKRLPRTRFVQADVGSWKPSDPVDLLFANAVFQWVPNHLAIFDRLMDGLAPGGVLAVQMPDNVREPSHQLMEDVAREGHWRGTFSSIRTVRDPLPHASIYYEALIRKAAHLDIWHAHYYHPLANAAAIGEWFKGSALRPYLEVLNPNERHAFMGDYVSRVANAYAPMTDGCVLLRFPRLFIVAVRS